LFAAADMALGLLSWNAGARSSARQATRESIMASSGDQALPPTTQLFREAEGVIPNLLAFTGAFGAYAVALALITAGGTLSIGGGAGIVLGLLGTVVLAASLIVSAYLIHEAAHGTLFRQPEHNLRIGIALAWVVGASYGPFAALREKHLMHHAERVDSVSVDYRQLLATYPWLRRAVERLESIGIPAVDLLMHAAVIGAPFFLPACRPQRARVITVLAVRAAFFCGLAWLWPPAIVFYAIGYMTMLHVLRFMDAYQHTYELIVVRDRSELRGRVRPPREFEEMHTYSNPSPWLNLVTLNFGYHNAHHQRPSAPWYRLPALHEELYGDRTANTHRFGALVRNYWRNRVHIVMGEYGVTNERWTDAATFPGALGVSFLTQF
jgi:fatty acid desaturase